MSWHVHTCARCGALTEGAALHASTAPRDRYGRIAHGYEGPTYCSETCRDEAENASIYAVCQLCAHVEPRPAHAAEDWAGCENCGASTINVGLHETPDDAEDASEAVLLRRTA